MALRVAQSAVPVMSFQAGGWWWVMDGLGHSKEGHALDGLGSAVRPGAGQAGQLPVDSRRVAGQPGGEFAGDPAAYLPRQWAEDELCR